MNATNRYLDRVQKARGLVSDYALAAELGIARQVVSNYRTGRRHLDARACVKVADLLGVPALEVISAVEADRAKSAPDRDFWRGQLQRLGAAAVLVCVAHMGAGAGEARASTLSVQGGAHAEIYIMRFRARLRRLVDSLKLECVVSLMRAA